MAKANPRPICRKSYLKSLDERDTDRGFDRGLRVGRSGSGAADAAYLSRRSSLSRLSWDLGTHTTYQAPVPSETALRSRCISHLEHNLYNTNSANFDQAHFYFFLLFGRCLPFG